jgi:hypothetical protein
MMFHFLDLPLELQIVIVHLYAKNTWMIKQLVLASKSTAQLCMAAISTAPMQARRHLLAYLHRPGLVCKYTLSPKILKHRHAINPLRLAIRKWDVPAIQTLYEMTKDAHPLAALIMILITPLGPTLFRQLKVPPYIIRQLGFAIKFFPFSNANRFLRTVYCDQEVEPWNNLPSWNQVQCDFFLFERLRRDYAAQYPNSNACVYCAACPILGLLCDDQLETEKRTLREHYKLWHGNHGANSLMWISLAAMLFSKSNAQMPYTMYSTSVARRLLLDNIPRV